MKSNPFYCLVLICDYQMKNTITQISYIVNMDETIAIRKFFI